MSVSTSEAALTAAAAQAATARTVKQSDAAFRKHASELALRYKAGRVGWAHTTWPHLEGAIEGVDVSVEMVGRLTDFEYQTVVTAIPERLEPGNLELSRESALSKITKLLGAQDLEVGDAAFDAAFLIKGTSEELARRVLDADVRAELLALEATRFAYDDGSAEGHAPMVLFEMTGVVEDPARLKRSLALVVRVARAR